MPTTAAPDSRPETAIDLRGLMLCLRSLNKAGARAFALDVADVAARYHILLSQAPRREQGYFSEARTGVPPIDVSGRRKEERIAMALFNSGAIIYPNGDRLRLLDYQFPLRSAHSDKHIGKVDLLGIGSDDRLAIIELKVEKSPEDRRIGLLEGLIYAAIIEANLEQIAQESRARSLRAAAVKSVRPKIMMLAPPNFWTKTKHHPLAGELIRLAEQISRAVPIEIELMNLHGLETVELGLDGSRPILLGPAMASPVSV